MSKEIRLVARLAIAVLLLGGLLGGAVPTRAQVPEYLHTEGAWIVNAAGHQVLLTGINWFGLETPNYAPHGLWARNWESLLDQVEALGFNTLRLPYSNQLFDPGSVPNGIDYQLNPDLQGLTGLEIMDKLIAGAGARGLKVILDRHRPDSSAQSDLWYTPAYGEERWISDWVMLAKRYAGNDTVVGVDLHNEPHGRATWGTDDPATDWRLAAERAGNAILAVNPDLLIIVQGVDQYQGDWYWWGGNLLGARDYPVRLSVPNRLVYSTHVYGPDVYPQPWFWDPDFPNNLPAIWDRHWAYLSSENIAPVVVGEFGGRSVGADREGIWQRTLVSFLREKNFSYFYWTLNPNSGDTGGLLLDDWKTVDPDKLALLSGYQFPLLGIEESSAPVATLPPPAAPVAYGSLRALFSTATPDPQARDSKPEFVIENIGQTPLSLSEVELRYWFSDTSPQSLVFHCDWAAIGCDNVLAEFGTSGSGQHYLQLRFAPGTPPLLAGQVSGEIKVRFNHADWSDLTQADDYSFGPVTTQTEWNQITLYVGDALVWGVEPGGAAPTAAAPTVAALATAEPAGATIIAASTAPALTATQAAAPSVMATAAVAAVSQPAGLSPSPVAPGQPAKPATLAWAGRDALTLAISGLALCLSLAALLAQRKR